MEICELENREDESVPIPVSFRGQRATLSSPRFESLRSRNKKQFGRRYFCVFNVSLSCARNAVDISSVSEHMTWPGQPNSDCQNYVAFYSDRNSTSWNDRFCGNEPVAFRRKLQGSSFLAVMWSDQRNNIGTFQFTASCEQRPTSLHPPSPAQAEAVGSGMEIPAF